MKPRRDIVWLKLHGAHGDLGSRVPAFLEAILSLHTRWFPQPIVLAYVHRIRTSPGRRNHTTDLIMVQYCDDDEKTLVPIDKLLGAAHLLHVGTEISSIHRTRVEQNYVNPRINIETYKRIICYSGTSTRLPRGIAGDKWYGLKYTQHKKR